ncbi:MAG: glycosyltransferase [Proteobacteria bacterium]|nr:glycosyltransferase [Pseudomonadota bacterium]
MNDKRKSILMVFPFAPWPARENGISIRYYPVLEHLSRKHDIDVFVHSDPRHTIPEDPVVRSLRRVQITFSDRTTPSLLDRILTATEMLSPFGRPYQFARYHSNSIFLQLREFVTGQRYDSVLWVMHEHRDLLKRLDEQFAGARKIYDSIDSPYLHYLREPRPAGLMPLHRVFDLWKTLRWEKSLLEGVDASAYISAPDAAVSANSKTSRAQVIPNGIYLAGEEISAAKQPAGASLGFLGNMGYPQNVRGSLLLYENVFLPLKEEFTNLRMMIIGRSPAAEIRALAGPDVEVTGTVESIWPYIAQANAFVYPMIGGAGLQNKILEAMHAGKPVVTTEICLKSIGAQEGKEILIGRNNEELRAHTRALLKNPEYALEVGMQGKAYVDRTFDMSRVLKRFERFVVGGKDLSIPPTS